MFDINYILSNLKYKCDIIALDTVDSTNNYAKENSLSNGDIVITTNQTAGKGRLGRAWETDGGLALTINIIPENVSDNIAIISLIMGTAVCEVLNELSGLDCKIKWPNDIVINGKKLCGILTEAVTEQGEITKVVCGVGVNINNKDFSKDLENKATSLFLETGTEHSINEITVSIANKFYEYITDGYILPKSFKDLCITLGKEVTVINGENSYNALALNIDVNGSLIVKTPDNNTHTVNSGEVSVRGIYGYI